MEKLSFSELKTEVFCFLARGQSPITIISFCSFGLNFVCCLHQLGYDKITQV